MKDDQDILEMSTGVKLRIRKPSETVLDQIRQAAAKDEPKAPRVMNHDKGREEENPNDPDYLQAHLTWQAESGLRMLDAVISSGTVIESTPDDMVGPEDADYADLLEAQGIVPATGKFTRYVQWVKVVACDVADVAQLSQRMVRELGVPEEDALAAAETFRRQQGRIADLSSAPGRHSGDGDNIPGPDAGAGPAV